MKFPWNKKKDNEFVVCDDCSIILDKNKASKVHISYYSLKYDSYYCPLHKKEYTKIDNNFNFFKEFRVAHDGTPYGYKKIKIRETKT